MEAKFNPPRLSDWAAEVRADPSPVWLIPQLLPADNLVLLSGHPKDGKKTWFVMDVALRAARAGHRVLYIYREGSRRPTLRRFEVLSESEDAFENIFFWHRGAFWLDEGSWVKHACRFITEHNIQVCIIDTLAKSMQSDENSSQHVGRAVQAAEKLRDSGATVILVHHLRKATHSLSNGESGNPEPDKDLRGSTALAGAYETHWAVRTYRADSGRDRKTYLLVGGKEIEWAAYTYDWQFDGDGDDLWRVRLTSEKLPKVPYIEGKDKDSSGWEI